jgi:CheY-like chemotaxis protein
MPAIIMSSAFGGEDLWQRAADLGITAFLAKPVMLPTLHRGIREALGLQAAGPPPRRNRVKMTANEFRALRGARALLVEDHPINQQVTREILEKAGMTVEVAVDGQEAVASVAGRGDTFDVILMDLQMPVMDGYEATRLIREKWSAADLPIIAMTAHALADERKKCLHAGMNGHITKPVDVAELYRCLLKWVRPKHRACEPPEACCSGKDLQEELPDVLPGLNVTEGLTRICGNAGLYRRLIIGFGRDRREMDKEIGAALAENDLERAGNLAHALRGVAGNLAATGLHVTAHDLETACSRGLAEEALQLLPALEARLAEVIAAAELLAGQAPQVDGTRTDREFDAHAVLSLLHELDGLSAEHNLTALKRIDRLVELLEGTEYAPLAARLADNLDRLDFASASRQVQALAMLLNDLSDGGNDECTRATGQDSGHR